MIKFKGQHQITHNTLVYWGFPSISAGKEPTCNTGDPGSIPAPVFLDFPGGSAGKESACNARDLESIPGLGRSPQKEKGYSL